MERFAADNPRIERVQEPLTEPIFGVHDMYGYRESVRGVDDLGIVGAKLDNARIFTNEGSTYGRVGNAISDGALKYALDDASGEAVFSITKGLVNNSRCLDVMDMRLHLDVTGQIEDAIWHL